MKIGILAVQGAFIEHEKKLNMLGIDCVELRQKTDLSNSYDALIFPGGESTVQGKLINELGMFDTLYNQILNGMPVLATCAGMILLAENISNDNRNYFKTLPVTVKRNAYGRQLGSFHTTNTFSESSLIPMTFIRAPYIESINPDVQILAKVDNNIVAVKYDNQIALSFHPELDSDTTIYKMFINLVSKGDFQI